MPIVITGNSLGVEPLLVEGLLVPFHVLGRAVGTVWVVAHDETRKFDAEDQRVLESLATFAATAYQTRLSIDTQAKANQDLQAKIVERQRAEETLREADRRKSEFLAMLAHELRNPLAPIRNAVYLLGRRRAPTASRAAASLERQASTSRGWSTTCSTSRGSRAAGSTLRQQAG